MDIKKASMRNPLLQSGGGTAQFQELETVRRRRAIRLVTLLSAAGLMIVLLNWIAGR